MLELTCAGVAQSAEHVHGKHEVTGSIPVSSLVFVRWELKGAATLINVGPMDRRANIPWERRVADPQRAKGERRAPIPVSSLVFVSWELKGAAPSINQEGQGD